jgi:hypothetical protein
MSLAATGRRRLSQRGQALPFVLVWLAVLGAVFWMVWGSGRVVAQKQQLLNVADAAAYGAAVWQARALNFTAYTNRAAVANEAAFAQAVSLSAWSSYMDRLLPRVNTLTRWIPYLGAATTALQRLWTTYDRGLQPTLAVVEGQLAVANARLVGAQQFMHLAANANLRSVLNETLAANSDPRDGTATRLTAAGEASVAQATARSAQFSMRYEGDARARQRDVVLASRDGFSRVRSRTLVPGPLSSVMRFEKRGGTELVGFDSWRGLDTHSLHLRSGLLLGSLRERAPLGWGASETGRASGSLRGVRRMYGNSYRVNPRASSLAEASMRRRSLYRGLPVLRDLSPAARQDDVAPRFVVRLTQTPSATGSGAESATSLYAQSVAEVRFIRPAPRLDGRRELPNLYSPYWHARLAPMSRNERIAGAAADGVLTPLTLLE